MAAPPGLEPEILDPESYFVYGFDVGYELTRTNLFSLMGSQVKVESRLNAFFGDVGKTNTLKGRWVNRIYFALIGPIYFNVTYELFFYRFSDRGYGLASDLTFGLSYNARYSWQTY